MKTILFALCYWIFIMQMYTQNLNTNVGIDTIKADQSCSPVSGYQNVPMKSIS